MGTITISKQDCTTSNPATITPIPASSSMPMTSLSSVLQEQLCPVICLPTAKIIRLDVLTEDGMIKIKAEIPHDMKCDVRIGGINRVIDSVDTEAVFDLDEGKAYAVEIYISTPARSVQEKRMDSILFFLTLPFRCLSALADVVPSRWTEDVCPYSARIKFKLGAGIGSNCVISYSGSKYDSHKKSWERPTVHISQRSDLAIEYSENTESFAFCYRKHAKNGFSLAVLGICVFGFLQCIAVKHSNIPASIVCGILFVALPLYALLTLLQQKRQMMKMQASFNAKTGKYDRNT